jgi:hypothetical protein
MRGCHKITLNNHSAGNSEEGFSKYIFSKLVSNSKKGNKKLIVKCSGKLLKEIENHQRIHRKY